MTALKMFDTLTTTMANMALKVGDDAPNATKLGAPKKYARAPNSTRPQWCVP